MGELPAFPAMEERYAFHTWPDGCAVFDRFSGDTHILDTFSAVLFLSGLQVSPAVIEKLRLPVISDENLSSRLDDARRRLEKLKLPAAPPS
ncbi:MAG: hypothetical protein KKF85_07850 [Gammaproteobacteria bacterium]|nr:hypothetical protein [Rhodocyclaceae bacterium]MBU3910111.1 hypothetical protein [Gammaproteobacteria bacterium]MBU3989879.1 hypothetical protein [Gammaproteobacteria bacterium]MBU4006119.1 hypothetical protein [Gammaproteobacteria bacterium]MBU4022573.1 hypothetical protein [Gammaproteobacteria bacterium]